MKSLMAFIISVSKSQSHLSEAGSTAQQSAAADVCFAAAAELNTLGGCCWPITRKGSIYGLVLGIRHNQYGHCDRRILHTWCQFLVRARSQEKRDHPNRSFVRKRIC